MKRKNRFAFITGMCAAIVLLTVIAVSAVAQTAEQRYNSLTPIPAVLEQNKSKIKRINDYGPEFVLDYIAENGSYYEIISTLTDIQLLSDELCLGIDDTYAKISIIARYVADTIAYDFDAAHNSVTFDIICLKNVLSRKHTTCAGYSNLFSALLNAQGIYCINIRGCSPEPFDGIYIDNLDSEDAVINHEWTAVWYAEEERWIYVDCTWNSQNTYSGGNFHKRNSISTFFDIPIEYLSIEHRAEIVDYRNFFSAPQAYNEDGIRWSELPDQTTHYVTQTTPVTSPVTEPTVTTVTDATSTTVTTVADTTTEVENSTSVQESGLTSDDSTTTALTSDDDTTETSVSTGTETEISEEKKGKGTYIVLFIIVPVAAGGGIAYGVLRKKKNR